MAGATAPRGEPKRSGRLVGVDPASLGDRKRIDLAAELERLTGSASAAQAGRPHTLRESREARGSRDAVRSVGSEVALARRWSPPPTTS